MVYIIFLGNRKRTPILLKISYIITLCTQYTKQVCQKFNSASHKTCIKFVEGIDDKKKDRSILEVLLRTDKQLINLLHFCLSEVFLQPQILILHVHVCMHVIACDITVYHLCLSALGPFPQLGLVNIFSRLWSANVQVYQSQTQ